MNEGALHDFIHIGDVTLHVVFTGPADGPPVVLLHGFPEFWYGWRHQIPALANAGYRVIVPDQRGYNLSDKPKRVRDYRHDRLVRDIIQLIDVLNVPTVSLIGHDWGGAVAWGVAARHADRIERLIVLNCPHPAVMYRHLRRKPRQMLRSWYIGWFQVPWLPEITMRLWNWRLLTRVLLKMSSRGSFTEDDLSVYREAWSQPGAITAMVDWYRALVRARGASPIPDQIISPTLLIWGERDNALGKELTPDSIALCDNGKLEYLPQAGHFVQHDAPGEVNRLILDFLAGTSL